MAFQHTYQRRKSRTAGSSSTPQQPQTEELVPTLHDSFFKKGKSLQAYQTQMQGRSIYIERRFLETIFVDLNWTWLENFKEWGWMEYLSIRENVCPNLVKVFYFNGDDAHSGDNGNNEETDNQFLGFRTTVRGENLNVNEEVIREYVRDKKNTGATRVLTGRQQTLNDCRVVFKNRDLDVCEKSCSKMDGCTRVLHYIVSQVFFPRAGNYSEATNRDLFIMARIMEGNPPNLSALILSRMLELVRMTSKRGSKKTNDYNLPYGKLVSRICKKLCNVPKDEPISNEGEMGPLTVASLTSNGWEQDPLTKRYVRKSTSQEPTNSEIMAKMTSFFGEIKNEVQELKRRQAALQAQNLLIHNHMLAQEHDEIFTDPFPSFENFQYPPPS